MSISTGLHGLDKHQCASTVESAARIVVGSTCCPRQNNVEQTRPQSKRLPIGLKVTMDRIQDYLTTWQSRGYLGEIPDEVPDGLMAEGIAPSYKAICLALLSNDMQMTSLGYAARSSDWYGVIKKLELEARKK